MTGHDRRAGDRRKQQVNVTVERRSNERRQAIDRRVATRVPLELWMEEVSGDDVYFRRTGNVSVGGVYFDRAIPHPLGTIVTLNVGRDKAETFRFLNGLKLARISNNLGDSKSLVTHPATTTHRTLKAEERQRLGITDALIRFSVGLEDPQDLIEDLDQALKAV